jgi:hypothetical protein
MADPIGLEDLLAGFGRAIVEAQGRILKASIENPTVVEGARTAFAISETELEVKVVFDDKGGGALHPLTMTSGRLNDLNPGALSTLRAKILAIPDEEPRRPKKTVPDVVKGIRERADLKRLEEIFGTLEVRADYIPASSRWVVDVVEPGGLTLRSLQIPD